MLRRIRKTATKASSTPIRIEPIASKAAIPVSWWSTMPAAASRMPSSAEKSSKKTARRVGLEVWLTKCSGCSPQRLRRAVDLARGLDERDALEHERDRQHDVVDRVADLAGLAEQLADPVPDRDDGAGREEPEGRHQRPDVRRPAVAARVRRRRAASRPRFSAISRNTSLPVSAHECAASATIAAEPVRKAATVLAVASSALATSATTTVSIDSPPDRRSAAGPARPPGRPRLRVVAPQSWTSPTPRPGGPVRRPAGTCPVAFLACTCAVLRPVGLRRGLRRSLAGCSPGCCSPAARPRRPATPPRHRPRRRARPRTRAPATARRRARGHGGRDVLVVRRAGRLLHRRAAGAARPTPATAACAPAHNYPALVAAAMPRRDARRRQLQRRRHAPRWSACSRPPAGRSRRSSTR